MSNHHQPIIRALAADDAAGYRALRLRALRDHPDAFAATAEDWEKRTAARGRWTGWRRSSWRWRWATTRRVDCMCRPALSRTMSMRAR